MLTMAADIWGYFTPLFLVIALLAFGQKMTSIARAIRQRNMGKLKAEVLFLSLMGITFFSIYLLGK